jgi:hypothetical protein
MPLVPPRPPAEPQTPLWLWALVGGLAIVVLVAAAAYTAHLG